MGMRRSVFSWFFGAGFCDPEPGAGGGAGAATAAPPAQASATQTAATQQAPAGITQAQLNSALQPLVAEMRQQLTTQLEPIRQQQSALQQQVEQMRQPVQQAAALFGGAPFIRQGENVLSSRGYQYWRAMGLRTGQVNGDDAKYELEVHRQLHEAYTRNGMVTEGQSILVPLGTSCLMQSELKQEFLTELRQSMAAGCDGFDLQRALWMRRQGAGLTAAGEFSGHVRQAMSQFDDTGLATFLGPTQRAGEMIDLLRNREVFSQLGATQLSLPPNGRLQFDRQTGATTAYWVGEVPSNASTPTITASAPTTGYLTLIAKKLAVLCKLPNELLRFATAELEAFLRADMVKVMGLEADVSMLEAVGSTNRIKGLINYSGIQSHTATTVATDGNTLEPKDLTLMAAKIENANHDPETGNFAWVMRAMMWANILERRADAVSAGDHKGPYLFPVNRGDISNGKPRLLNGYPVAKSNQISGARTKGSSSDLTYILAGLWNHWLIARVGVMEFATTTSGDTPFQTDQTWIRAIQHIDAGPRYENAFIMCDSLDPELGI